MKLLKTFHLPILLLGLLPTLLFSQSSAQDQGPIFEIDEVVANTENKRLELRVKAIKRNGQALIDHQDLTSVAVLTSKGDNTPYELNVIKIKPLEMEEGPVMEKGGETGPKSILFLLDLSGSMRGEKLEKAKAAIKRVLDSDILKGADIQFAWFHDLINESMKVSKYNYEAKVGVVDVGPEGKGKDTDLHRAIKKKVDELKGVQGLRAIVLLTDGKNDIDRNPIYKGSNAIDSISEKQILDYVQSETDTSFLIYPVGVGSDADEDFLKAVADRTPSNKDYYRYGIAPEDVANVFISIVSDLSEPNVRIDVLPNRNDACFGPEKRRFILQQKSPETGNTENAKTKYVVLGSAAKEVCLTTTASAGIEAPILTGIAILVLLLAILSFSVPIYNDRKFKAKYVKLYRDVKIPNRVRKDPLTLEEYNDNDEVVVNEKGDKMMKLSSWKYYRDQKIEDQAGEHAELFQLETNSGDFFSQRGVFKKLNWLWFGAIGGFLAWCLNTLLLSFEWEGYRQLLKQFDQVEGKTDIASSIFNETMIGIAMGTAIVGALAVVEEQGQSRKFNIGRILLRILIGAVMGFIVFFLESTFIATVIPVEFFGSLIGWVIFGSALGLVVALFSSIQIVNGLKGGLIAGSIAFVLYYLLNMLTSVLPANVAAVISLICYGALLGYTLFTIVTQLESFELLCLSPKTFAGWKSPISKWLKDSNIDFIRIGSHPKNRVYIKWHSSDPSIVDYHARLSHKSGQVFITPDQGEVWVDGKAASGPTLLKNESRIQLGKSGYSQIQFIAKEGNGTGGTGGQGPHQPSIKVKRRSQKEVEAVRRQIKVTRR